MSCEQFDWKAYALGDLAGGEAKRAAEHLKDCVPCSEELESLHLTVTALKRLPLVAPPRRIAFVSDPVIEPNWWARLWASGPRLAFASAAMLSLAILAHGFMARKAAPVAVETAGIESRVEQEVARLLPAAVDAGVSAKLTPALSEFRMRLDGIETEGFEKIRAESRKQREADLSEVRSAFDVLERRINVRYLSAAKYGGD